MSDRNEALGDLMADIFRLEETGQHVPCVNPNVGHYWVSEDYDLQDAAATACESCPALLLCQRYTEEYPESGGVWAAIVPPRRGRRRKAVAR